MRLTLTSFLLKALAKFLNSSGHKAKKPQGGCSYSVREQLPKRRSPVHYTPGALRWGTLEGSAQEGGPVQHSPSLTKPGPAGEKDGKWRNFCSNYR